MRFSRRDCVKTGLIAAAGIAVNPTVLASQKQLSVLPEISIFSKCLQFLNYRQIAGVVSELGFNGIDLTVRKGGLVIPDNVTEELPKVVKEMKKNGLNVIMATTDIVDANDLTENIIEIAASLGIKYYRMGRLKYSPRKSIIQNLDDHKRTLSELEKLNRKYHIHGCIQNHSGPYNMVGAPVWDLHYLLKDFDPEFIGVQYDIMHATVEGGYSWSLGLELQSPWIKTIDIKDFVWDKDKTGKWRTRIVPLGEGMVDFGKFLNEIERLDIQATYSIHYEYDLGGAEHGSLNPDMDTSDIIYRIKKDLMYFIDRVS